MPRQENKPGSGYSPLKECILFLTSEDAELGDEHEEATEFYAFFFTDEFVDPMPDGEDFREILKDFESKSRGIPTDIWVQRMAKLEKDLHINHPLSGDDLRSLSAQMQNGSDGFAISWQDMEAYICFGETTTKNENPAKVRDRARVLNDVRKQLREDMKVSDDILLDKAHLESPPSLSLSTTSIPFPRATTSSRISWPTRTQRATWLLITFTAGSSRKLIVT